MGADAVYILNTKVISSHAVFLSSNFGFFTTMNVNNWVTSSIYYNSISAWYLVKDHDQFISGTSQHTLSKEYGTWFIIRFINYIQKFYFYFCVYIH